MPTRSTRRRAGRIAGVGVLPVAVCAAAGIGAGMARPQPAGALAAAPGAAAGQAVADRIEREAWTTGLAVYLGLRYPAQQVTVTRDAYCAQHQAG